VTDGIARLAKVTLLKGYALYLVLVVFNNLTDHASNY
jgi:predicted small integral membrane protein